MTEVVFSFFVLYQHQHFNNVDAGIRTPNCGENLKQVSCGPSDRIDEKKNSSASRSDSKRGSFPTTISARERAHRLAEAMNLVLRWDYSSSLLVRLSESLA